jgi:hypothetical protein
MMAFSLGFPAPTIARIALACHPAAHDRPARRDRHFRVCLKYLKSGGAWSFLAGINKSSALMT